MMDRSWSVHLDYLGDVDEATAHRIAVILTDELPDGVGSGRAGEVSATFTSEHDSVAKALELTRVVTILQHAAPGVRWQLVAAEVVDHDELARRLQRPVLPELVGIAEVADMLGVTKQRASTLQSRHGFPTPVAHVAATPLWLRASIEAFDRSWTRKPGRPAKAARLTSEVAKALNEELDRLGEVVKTASPPPLEPELVSLEHSRAEKERAKDLHPSLTSGEASKAAPKPRAKRAVG